MTVQVDTDTSIGISLSIAVYVSIGIGKFIFLVSQIFDDITQLHDKFDYQQ